MNTKKLLFIAGIFSMTLLASAATQAQQQKPVLPGNTAQKEIANNDAGNYSYKLYNAPNNMYGYDIYKDGKPVYHQFVLMYISKEGKRLIATKPQAQKAALIAIGKIKQGQPPMLSGDDLKKIIAL